MNNYQIHPISKNQMKPKYFPYIPIMANEIFLEGNKGKIYGRNREKYAKIGKISRKEPG